MISFQFHVTLEDFALEQQEDFRSLCASQQVKPLMIELSHGNYIHQPMFSKLVDAESFAQADRQAEASIAVFVAQQYAIVRKKAEVPPEDACFFTELAGRSFVPYYEWHGKVKVVNYPQVEAICHANAGHLSRNAFDPDHAEYYVTLRNYGSCQEFDHSVKALLAILQDSKVPIIKQKFEYCIFDSRLELDGGWAS